MAGVGQVSSNPGLPTVTPIASTSAGSVTLHAALDATVELFPTPDSAVYSLDGNVATRYEWLQLPE